MTTSPEAVLPPVVARWFEDKGWAPRRHQLEMLAAARSGRNALLVAPTGAGKTLAGFLASIAELRGLAIGNGPARLRPVASVYDRQRLRHRTDRAVAVAGMVATAIGEERGRPGTPGSTHASAGRT